MKHGFDPAEVALFRDLVRARTGMALPESRASDLDRAVRRAAADSGAPDAGALYRLLVGRTQSGHSLDALITALNVSETHFFRDAGQIQALEQRILPELIARRRPERRLRLWSAGCSTGEEAYTLAILVRRLLPDLPEWDVLILATDINGRSLERARRGVYGAWSLRGTPPFAVNSYLPGDRNQFEVAPNIRAMVSFARLNLAEDVYPSLVTNTEAMDLVLCRNVLLYFDEEGGRAVVGRLRRSLADGGRLVVSQVEAGFDLFEGLEQDGPVTAVYRKVDPKPAELRLRREESTAVRDAAGPERPNATSPPLPPRDRGAGDPTPTSAPAPAHQEALRLWRSGQAEAALRCLEAATESPTLAAPLHYVHGLILLDGERPDEALAAFRRSTYADPGFAPAHLAQAGLFLRMSLPGRARAALDATARLVAGLAPDTLLFEGEGPTVGAALEMIAAQRELLTRTDAAGGSRG